MGCFCALRRCSGAFTATRGHQWLKANVMPTGSPGTFLPSCSPQPVLVPGAISPQGQDPLEYQPPSFTLYGNLPRIHSGPWSSSLMKVLNNSGLSTDSYSIPLVSSLQLNFELLTTTLILTIYGVVFQIKTKTTSLHTEKSPPKGR